MREHDLEQRSVSRERGVTVFASYPADLPVGASVRHQRLADGQRYARGNQYCGARLSRCTCRFREVAVGCARTRLRLREADAKQAVAARWCARCRVAYSSLSSLRVARKTYEVGSSGACEPARLAAGASRRIRGARRLTRMFSLNGVARVAACAPTDTCYDHTKTDEIRSHDALRASTKLRLRTTGPRNTLSVVHDFQYYGHIDESVRRLPGSRGDSGA